MVRIALSIVQAHADYADVRRAALEAESLGVDVLYLWDHFFPTFGDPGGKHLECWSLLAALAEATRSVKLGSLVTCSAFRNPDLLADMARTADHVSGGRMILGMGSGWHERDFREYGFDYGTARARLRDLEHALTRIGSRLGRLNPPPVGPLPLLIGGGGEKVTLRLAAEYADIWHGFAIPTPTRSGAETIRHKNAVLDDWCRVLGRDPATIERSVGVHVSRIDLADSIVDAGADEVQVAVRGPELDLGPVKAWVAWRDRRDTLNRRESINRATVDPS